MFIDVNYLLGFGLPLSDEISYEKMERAISTAENIVIKPRLGYKLYAEMIENPSEYVTEVDGGVLVDGEDHFYVAGLKEAEAHIAFAILLAWNLNATSFGSVLKNDDYSSHADEDRLRRTCMQHTEIGMAYLKEITDYHKVENDRIYPNICEELI